MKLLGIDFDNTLVNYDNLFHKVAVEKGLIKYSLPANKIAIRDYLREKVGTINLHCCKERYMA